jgi:hypothetical protein
MCETIYAKSKVDCKSAIVGSNPTGSFFAVWVKLNATLSYEESHVIESRGFFL